MSEQYNELKSLFIKDVKKAVNKCENIIVSFTTFNSYQDFYTYHLKNHQISTCQNEWATQQMSIHCYDCAIDQQSCVCIHCFLKGNHQNHDYTIFPFTTGNCDCGDLTLWKHSGCCKEHQGLNEDDHPENYIDEKLRNILTDVIFKAAFASFPHIQYQNESIMSAVFQFLSSFLKLGDGFRRLIVISLTERIKFEILLGQIFQYKLFFNKLFQQLCGGLINDQLFKVNFALANYKLIIKRTIPDAFSKFISPVDDKNYSIWNTFWFHSFSPQPIKAAVERHHWDWVTFLLDYSKYMKQFFHLRSIVNYYTDIPNFLSEISSNMPSASSFQPNEETQRFFDQLFTNVLNCGTNGNKGDNDTIISASFYEMHDDFYYFAPVYFSNSFYPIMKCFKNKKNLKFEKLIDELDRTIDLSQIYCIGYNKFGDENDLFVSKYIDKVDDISKIIPNKDSQLKVSIEDHYKSFHNGGAFFFSMPLFDSLLYLFQQDNMNRVKIASLLSLSKYKKLRIQLGIVALKKLIAFYCMHQSLISKKNYSILTLLLPFVNIPTQVHHGIPLLMPFIQLLFGLQSEDDKKLNEFSIKEFFAFEMARELGIFDDYTDDEYKDEDVLEKQKQMLTTFLFVSLLLNVERTLFNFDCYKFIEEQIIFALKKGLSSPAELNKMYCMHIGQKDQNHKFFNSILSKVAKMTTNNKSKNADGDYDVSFTLKEGITCKTISAIIPFNDQNLLLNNEIKKNPNTLIKIPEFEDESDFFFHPEEEAVENANELNSTNIKLKEFLSTPTVLAVTYHTLRMSADKAELSDHFAMNILILISKFAEEDLNSNTYDSSLVIHYKSVSDLISQMKKVLFDFKIDTDGTSTISNTLNKGNFKAFLNIKIGSNKLEPKSIIDILSSKGELGRNVLHQLSVDIEVGDDEQEKRKIIKQMNKERANKLKTSIINKYKNIISNYYTNDGDSPEETSNDDDIVCSICSSVKKDEILSFPLYIYRTKLPFIIDKPPLVEINDDSVLGVDEDEMNESRDFIDLLMQKNKKKEKSKNSSGQKYVTEGKNFVIQFSICQHHIHQSCENRLNFLCPIDRSRKNGFLPCLDKFDPSSICSSEKVDPETIERPIKDSISGFIKNFKSFSSVINDVDLFIELVKSISGLIATYEIRLRSLPGCLDSSKNKILARNLFLTTWYAYRLQKKPEIECKSERLTLFQKFVMKMIECDELEGINNNKNEAFQRIFSSFADKFNETDETRREKEIFLFLRRICLSDYFLLNNEIEDSQSPAKFIDWDEILSVSNFSQKFNISLSKLVTENGDDFEFKPIAFTKMPKEFLNFAGEPFNFPIEKTMNLTVYNILDYNFFIQNYDDFEPEKLNQNDQVLRTEMNTFENGNLNIFLSKLNNKNCPTVFLFVGKDASTVVIIDNSQLIKLKPFYVDKFGCPDVGFRRCQPLFLHEEKYTRMMDLILSGDFSFYSNI